MYTQSYMDITEITIYTYYYVDIYILCPTILLLGDLPTTGVLEHLRHGQHFILKLSSCVLKLEFWGNRVESET